MATQGKAASQTGDSDAIQKRRVEWNKKLVRSFGDDEGNEVTFNGTVVQALLMMNGRDINDVLRPDSPTIAQALKVKNSGKGVATIYMSALSRPPENREIDVINHIASKTGGKFFRATDTRSLQNIYDEIDRLEKTKHEFKKFEHHTELFAWAIIPALSVLGASFGLSHTRFRRMP